MKQVLCFVACLLAMPMLHAQTVYKSIGPDGKFVYSDRPPDDGKVTKTMKFQNLPSTAVPASTLSELEQFKLKQSPSSTSAGPVLYAAAWCGYCRQAKAYIASKGIRYEERDIDTAAGKAAYAQTGGSRGIPLLIVKGERIQGYSAEAYDFVFAKR